MPRTITMLQGLAALVLCACVTLVPMAARSDPDQDLLAEVEALRKQVAELERLVQDQLRTSPAVAAAPEEEAPRVSFGGQYRINGYTVHNDTPDGRQTAARVRIRQDLDFRFTEHFKTHLQLELGHTPSNRTTTATSVRVRHAVMDYTFERGPRLQAGIVPLSDYFGDALFSSDWDYNPVALSLTSPLWGGDVRLFGGSLHEGLETDSEDDFAHYQLDYRLPLSEGNELNFGATLATLEGFDGGDHLHANVGIGGRWRLREDLHLQGFLVGSQTARELIAGASGDARGLAVKLELTSERGFGVLATYATGDSDRTGFLPTMALAETYGYWGYTGILTVQGPTDTGFDGDAVNVSNNGFGLATVQVKYSRKLADRLDGYLAAGWFGATRAPQGRDSLVGLDLLAMGTYHVNDYLALDFGVGYARLGDSVSGYFKGVRSPLLAAPSEGAFNQPPGDRRDKYVLFTRLQAEF